MEEIKKIPERTEIEEQYKWAIHDIYASDELWEADLQEDPNTYQIFSMHRGNSRLRTRKQAQNHS